MASSTTPPSGESVFSTVMGGFVVSAESRTSDSQSFGPRSPSKRLDFRRNPQQRAGSLQAHNLCSPEVTWIALSCDNIHYRRERGLEPERRGYTPFPNENGGPDSEFGCGFAGMLAVSVPERTETQRTLPCAGAKISP